MLGRSKTGFLPTFKLLYVSILNWNMRTYKLLIYSLKSSFNHLTTTLMFGKEIVDYEEVVSTLKSHQTMQKLETGNSRGEGLSMSREWVELKKRMRVRQEENQGLKHVWRKRLLLMLLEGILEERLSVAKK